MDIDLSTDAAPSPERTRQLAETFAELARVLCHQTRHHEALRYPADADRLVRDLSAMAGRLPQLLAQAGECVAKTCECCEPDDSCFSSCTSSRWLTVTLQQ